MKEVKRPKEPSSLKKNYSAWTKELLQNLALGEKPKYKYGKQDIKTLLKKMYSSLCCYCESNTETTGFGQIEHRLPKRYFPKQTYQWENLHWSCFRCNNNKGDWYDEDNPILDATKDIIKKHLNYECYMRIFLSHRGANTINVTDLNRRNLRLGRKKLLIAIFSLLETMKLESIPTEKKEIVLGHLKEFEHGEYGSFISYILENEQYRK